MTLQPPSEYPDYSGAAGHQQQDALQVPAEETIAVNQGAPADKQVYEDAPGTSAQPVAAPPTAPAEPRQMDQAASPKRLADARVLSTPPFGLDVVGGTTVRLNRAVALDRLASGYGFLTIEWPVHQRGYDLLALQDGSSVSARGNAIAVDLSDPLGRVLIATGTRGTTTLPATTLRVTTASTHVEVPIDGGTSLGVWPRLTITKVDEFVIIRHERDPLSGNLSAVAKAYGYDERNFTLAKSIA